MTRLRIFRASLLFVTLFGLFGQTSSPTSAKENAPIPTRFLPSKSAKLVRATPESLGGLWSQLTDARPGTSLRVPLAIRDIEFLVELPAAVQTITSWSVTANGNGSPVRVQLLASTVSAESGFHLLRDDIVPANGRAIELNFEDAASRWLLIRLEAVKSDLPISIGDISVVGYDGSPKTRYRFDESPAAALDVITGLQNGAAAIQLSDDERSLFADASDGKFDTWTFAEAALLASGVTDKSQRQPYLKRIDEIERAARKIVQNEDSDFAKADSLLRWMHSKEGPFARGYVAKQTDVSTILDDQTFNCVSSATLYNIIGRRLGLNMRAIEVPDHAFSVLYDGTQHADVETTNGLGFNPGRHASIRKQLEQQTGFRYVPDKHRDLRREINSVQLVAIIYYNHGVTHSHEKKHREALVDYFRAMSMDAEFNSAVKNALAAMINWGNELSSQEEFRAAADVIEIGLRLARSDASLNHNRRVVYSQWARQLAESGQADEAIAVLRQARRIMPDEQFVSLQSWVFIREAETLLKAGKWRVALATAGRGQTSVDREAVDDLLQWKAGCYLRWGNDALRRDKHDEAIAAVVEGLELFPQDRRLLNNLAYTVQEWASHLNKTQSPNVAREKLLDMQNRFPKHKGITEVGANFARNQFVELRDAGRFEEAISCVEENAKLFASDGDPGKMFRNAYDAWARKLMKQGEWNRAIDIYARGLKQLPDDRLLRQNVVFCVQEWTKDSAVNAGDEQTRKLLREQVARFGELKGLQDVADRWVSTAVNQLIDQRKHEEALSLLEDDTTLMRKQAWEKSLRQVIDRWAMSFSNEQKWQQAIDVYDLGLKRLPKDSHLQRNAAATWHAWARPPLDAKNWDEAIRIYKMAVEKMPEQGSLAQNLRYCQQESGAAEGNVER